MSNNSLILAADDLQVGQHVAIHSWRDEKKHWLGDALDIKAVCLPYLVLKFVSVQEWPSVTLDTVRAIAIEEPDTDAG